METNYKAQLRETLSLNGLRTNADPVPSPNIARKRALLVPTTRPHPLIPDPHFLIKQNGSENASRLRAKYAFPPKTERFREWLGMQIAYVAALSNRDRTIMRSYTYWGDTLVNNYGRGTLHDLTEMFETRDAVEEHLSFLGYYIFDLYDTLPGRFPPRSELLVDELNGPRVNTAIVADALWTNKDYFVVSENMAPLLAAYYRDLKRIIEAAPRVLSPLVVYRGFKSESHLRGLEYENPDFVSTSLRIQSALRFSKTQSGTYYKKVVPIEYYGGMYEITIGPEIPCLYMEMNTFTMGEFELLLPPGLHFTFDSKIHYKKFPQVGPQSQYAPKEMQIAIIHTAVRLKGMGGRRRTRRQRKQQ